jgi:hypothetical protein
MQMSFLGLISMTGKLPAFLTIRFSGRPIIKSSSVMELLPEKIIRSPSHSSDRASVSLQIPQLDVFPAIS